MSGKPVGVAERLQSQYLKRHLRPVLRSPSLRRLSASTAFEVLTMTNLRQGRWLQVFCDLCSAKSSVAAAVLAGALLLPGTGVAAPNSRARHPLPTPLHVSHVTESGSHAAGKKHKGTLKSRTGAEAEGTGHKRGSGSGQSGKKGSKGRGRRAEPVEDPVPMFRAQRDGRRNGHAATHAGISTARSRRHGGYVIGPAPLVSSLRHGHGPLRGTTHLHERPEYAENAPAPIVRNPGRRAPLVEDRKFNQEPGNVGSAAGPSEGYAEGVSRPEDDERLPRVRGAAGGAESSTEAAASAAPAASVSAGPPRGANLPSRQPQVVQGFGGEVAVPSAASPDRPGGTRRRNHPSTWGPEPAALNAEPLEERETITEAAMSPAVLPELYDRSGRLVMRAPLKGSHDVLVHQNVMADNDGLERIQTDADLERLRAAHLLVSLPASESLHVNEDLPANRRVARPWTAMFAADIGRAFYARFREPIYLTSAARTVQYQARLQTVNGNAAGLWGDTASPHLTGQAVDLAKRGMSGAELAWMRGYLLPLMQSGKIDVEEEFHQACFHVSVYKSYAAGRRVLQHEVAQVHTAVVPVQAPADTANPDQ